MVIMVILPNIGSLFESKPLYQFRRDSTYSHRRKTSINKVEFYVSEEFIKKYPKMKDFEVLEPSIEKEYLEYTYMDCREVIQRKQTYEYYIAYTYSQYERAIYKQKLANLNYNSCERYNELKDLIK